MADLIARGLGRTPQFININFASIDQSVVRGDADIGLSGIEDTPAHRTAFAVTVPLALFYPHLTFFLLFCAVSIASSRIVLGMHFLTDVVAGCLIGSALGYLCFLQFS